MNGASLERSADRLPDQIGPYRILEVLGRGGMGVVYRGKHSETGEQVAVKTVRVPFESLLVSIRREIHALASIKHPGVVRIVAEGLQEGLPWYAMELLDGVSLRWYNLDLGPTAALSTINSGSPIYPRTLPDESTTKERLPAASGTLITLLSIIQRLCMPLAYLHGEGFVHCDLKPDNILIRPDGQPVLVDFGLMSRFSGAVGREALEVENFVGGSIAYMAPEQLQGDLVDARADLYSLGCILYELVTGRLPFHAETLGQLLTALQHNSITLPSQLVDGVPAELDALIVRLLAKKPSDRLGHAADVATVLAGLTGQSNEPVAELRPRAYLYRPRFAGRVQILHKFRRMLNRLRSGHGGIIFIGGESGIGKTRFVMEAACEAKAQGIPVYTGECLPLSTLQLAGKGSGLPLHPLKKLLQTIADRCRARGDTETERLLGPRGKVLALYEPTLLGLPGQQAYPEAAELPVESARLRLFSYLADTLTAFADNRPLIFILDDLQWADDLTLGFLELLLRERRLIQLKILVLATYRSEEVDRSLQALIEHSAAERRQLERLNETALEMMIGDMLALTPPPSLFARFLTRKSAGNPFFVAEYLRTAVLEGLFYRDARGSWQIAGAAQGSQAIYESLPLPSSLRELLKQRLNRLSQQTQNLLEIAAVLGREFDAALLADAIEADETSLMEGITELLARNIIEELATGYFRFVHEQIREVAYQELTDLQRSILHRAAANSIESIYPDSLNEWLTELGQHWQEAGEKEKALPYYLKGARQAAARYAYVEAERLYRAYLALVETPTVESVEVHNELSSKIFWYAGRMQEAIAEKECALAQARILGDLAGQSASLHGLANIYRTLEQLDQSREFYDQALAIYRQRGDRRGEGIILSDYAALHFFQSRLSKAEQMCEQALVILREVGERRHEGITLNRLAILQHQQGRSDQAFSLYNQAIAINREVGDRHNEGAALTNIATIYFDESRLPEASVMLEQALTILREIGDRLSEAIPLLNLANTRREQGHLSEAWTLYEQSREISHQVGDRLNYSETLWSMAIFKRQVEGNYSQATELLEEAEAIVKELDNTIYIATYLCQRGHLALASQGDAGALLEQVEKLVSTLQVGKNNQFGKAIARFQRAVTAAQAGQPLWHGECWEDLPIGLRQALTEKS
ncbi:MAG: tetratricopeptide repeat protein [Acidobacteriota bacterium]